MVEPLIRVLVAGEGVCRLLAEIRCKTPDRQVHRRQSPGGGVALLAIDGDVVEAATVGGHEGLAGDEHAAGTAARVVHPALVGRQHRHQQLHAGGGREELTPLLALRQGELAEKVFVDLANRVALQAGIVAEADCGDEIHQFPQAAWLQLGPPKAPVQLAAKNLVVVLNHHQGGIDAGADVGLLGLGPQHLPAGGLRHPEDVVLFVVVAIVQSCLVFGRVIAHVVVRGGVADPGQHGGLVLREGVGDELQEDQPQHQMLIFGRIHLSPQFVCTRPEHGLEILGGCFLLGPASTPLGWCRLLLLAQRCQQIIKTAQVFP